MNPKLWLSSIHSYKGNKRIQLSSKHSILIRSFVFPSYKVGYHFNDWLGTFNLGVFCLKEAWYNVPIITIYIFWKEIHFMIVYILFQHNWQLSHESNESHESFMFKINQMWHHVWFFWLLWLIGLMLHNVWHHMVTCDHIICKPSWSVLFLLLRMNLTIKSLGRNRALMGFIFQHSSLCLQLNKICQNFWLDSLIDGSPKNYSWNIVPSIL